MGDGRAAAVLVWGSRLDRPPPQIERLHGLLSRDERRRATRFSDFDARRRFVVARGLLRTGLARVLDVEPHELTFSTSAHGKPYPTAPDAASRIEFNVAHSDEHGLFACSFGGPVGVDVERVRRVDDLSFVARRHFSTAEIAALEALPYGEQAAAFYRCWTRKEAFVKAHGQGFSYPLADFDVSLDPNHADLTVRSEPSAAARWIIHPVHLFDGYAAAVVAGAGSTLEFVNGLD